MRVPGGSRIGVVAVFNIRGTAEEMAWLSEFRIFVGTSSGNREQQCGKVQTAPAERGPFTVDCGGKVGSWVTLRLVGSKRHLAIAELEIFEAP